MDLNINQLLNTCVYIMEHSRKKTLSPRVIQTSFRIMFMNNRNVSRTATSIATKYTTVKSNNENIIINNINMYEEILRNFINNEAKELVTYNLKLSKYSSTYLCGLGDYFNNQVQIFN
jgi:hypothetical protein